MRESEVAQLCLTLSNPWTAAYQAPPSMGFSRQEYWSGFPVPSPKDWLNGYKNKTPIYAVYKRPTSKKGHIEMESEDLEKVFHAKGDQKKVGVAILISDNIDFEIKIVKETKDTI